MSTTRLSLAQQVALLQEAAPVDLDPDDTHAPDPDSDNILTEDPAAREHYLQVGPSTLRKQHDSISDPKYAGVKTTREQIMEEGGESRTESEIDEEDEASGDEGMNRETRGLGGEEEEEGEEGVPSESEEEKAKDVHAIQERSVSPQEPVDEPTDLSSTLRQKRDQDREKGSAVSRQIALWDSLLDARIRLQKLLTAANKLPKDLELQEYTAIPECQESMSRMLYEAAALSDEIFELQEHLVTSNESITPPPRKRRKIQSNDETLNYAEWFQDATSDMSAFEERYHPHLIQTLTKWSAKIQAVAPSVLLPPNRNAFSAKSSQHAKSILQLIDDTLADHDKLLARTQVRRGKCHRIGVSVENADEGDKQAGLEVFDDTDFYQQLLRSVIDSRGNGSGEDWISIQKQKKAKKRVDTKASKGRKLRYEVHEKLQNFMVPVPVIGGWHEEQIDELFASILSKGFENALADDEDTSRRTDEEVDASLKGGFRVFG